MKIGFLGASDDRAPWHGVTSVRAWGFPGGVARLSGCHGWQLDDRIIAQRRDRFQAHVSAALNRPFVILFKKQRPDKPNDGVLVWEDADHVGAALDLAVEPLERINGVKLRPVIL